MTEQKECQNCHKLKEEIEDLKIKNNMLKASAVNKDNSTLRGEIERLDALHSVKHQRCLAKDKTIEKLKDDNFKLIEDIERLKLDLAQYKHELKYAEHDVDKLKEERDQIFKDFERVLSFGSGNWKGPLLRNKYDKIKKKYLGEGGGKDD